MEKVVGFKRIELKEGVIVLNCILASGREVGFSLDANFAEELKDLIARAVKPVENLTPPIKLNIGCGKVKYPGWLNIDIQPGADLVLDVRQGLPFEDNSVDFIYSEHFWEHLTLNEAETVLQEFFRCLKTGGVVRIATPDLDYLIQKYLSDWKNQAWLRLPEYSFISSRGLMFNISFYSWDHKYVYNEEDLRNQLSKAGFKQISRCELGFSAHPELCNLETREESKLILEAVK